MDDPAATAGIVAGIYALTRVVEGGIRKLVGLLTANNQLRIQDKEAARIEAQFDDIKQELQHLNRAREKETKGLAEDRVSLAQIIVKLEHLEGEMTYLRKRISTKIKRPD